MTANKMPEMPEAPKFTVTEGMEEAFIAHTDDHSTGWRGDIAAAIASPDFVAQVEAYGRACFDAAGLVPDNLRTDIKTLIDLGRPWHESSLDEAHAYGMACERLIKASGYDSSKLDGQYVSQMASEYRAIVSRAVAGVMGQREEILRAFVAKYGFEPEEAMQIVGADGSWQVVRRTETLANLSALEQGVGRD